MQLESVSFGYKNGFVNWLVAGKDAPTCDSDNPKFKGKPFKWQIHAVYGDHQIKTHSFVSPTPTAAKRFLQNIKSQIPKYSQPSVAERDRKKQSDWDERRKNIEANRGKTITEKFHE